MSLSDAFYFISHPKGDKAKIKVVKLSYARDYERSQWCAVNDDNYTELDVALKTARSLATKYQLEYQLYTDSYDPSNSEKAPSLTL